MLPSRPGPVLPNTTWHDTPLDITVNVSRTVIAFVAGAAVASAGSAIAARALEDPPIPEQIATLRERVQWLEQADEARSDRMEQIEADLSLAVSLPVCIDATAVRWVRRDGVRLLAMARDRGARKWIGLVRPNCVK